ncbi:hypothetical protein OAM22_04535, partial [Candidatus Pelagibacter sp.]|nr:hypothetical protein [Candidatus Pelagibacter sp.]
SLFLFFKIIYSFFKISFLNRKVQLLGNEIFSNNSINYWPIIKPYWEVSFKSIDLFKNLYYYHLIKNFVLKRISQHDKLFYLFENQPWERSLCFYYKKKFSKKKIIGISHTPIRFWDLRFFNSKKNNLGRYSPNIISFVNSYSQKIYKKDYKNQVFIKLEALRYNNLKINFNNKKKEKILIIGDYLDSENLNMRSLIAKSTLKNYDFLYLPHPSNKKIIYKQFSFLKSKNELKLQNISKVIIPHISTSIIEYILNYKDVLVILNDSMPNMSTLFMSSYNAKYIYDINDLNIKISEKKHNLPYKGSEFMPFGANKKLIFWKKLLSNDFKK